MLRKGRLKDIKLSLDTNFLISANISHVSDVPKKP